MLDCLYTHQFVGQFVRISIGTFAWDPPTRISVFTRNSNDVCWVLCTPTHASRCNAVPVVSSCIKENKNNIVKKEIRVSVVCFFFLFSLFLLSFVLFTKQWTIRRQWLGHISRSVKRIMNSRLCTRFDCIPACAQTSFVSWILINHCGCDTLRWFASLLASSSSALISMQLSRNAHLESCLRVYFVWSWRMLVLVWPATC